jgi:hypothetical protein
MKYDLKIGLISYDGKPFTRTDNLQDGQTPEPLTLKDVLISACVNADPHEYNDTDKKLAIFEILMRLHEAKQFVDLSAEQVSVLKKLVGKQLTVIAVGAVCRILENPMSTERKN